MQIGSLVFLMIWKHIGYSQNEALGYGVPIVTTPLTVCNELPIPEGARLVCNWDMSNVDEIAEKIFEKKVKPFEYKIPEDGWGKLLAKGKSKYKAELEEMVEVKCISSYYDTEIGSIITKNDDTYFISKKRADFLLQKGAISLV